MADDRAVTLRVRILGIRTECAICGVTAFFDHDHDDAFTEQVLEPLYSWFMAHRMPQIVEVVVVTTRDDEAEVDDGVDG